MAVGLYIHIPFCARKCAYCSFYSLPGGRQQRADYLRALGRHIALWGQRCSGETVDSIYFGGGTPSLLADDIPAVLDAVRRHFNVAAGCEISMECNPATIAPHQYAALRKAGVDRLSFGVQSTCDAQLVQLGRLHTVQQAKDSLLDARAAGFSDLSVDFMLGLPGQQVQAADDMAAFLHETRPTHISAYMLKLEPGTPLYAQKDALDLPDEDAVADLYLAAVQAFSQLGYDQYEISNFARPGRRCVHNMKYWQLEDYIGIGPAAHSLYRGRRCYYPSDLSAFLGGGLKLLRHEGRSDLEEYCMLRLRLTDGLDVSAASRQRRSGRLPPDPDIDLAAVIGRAAPLAAAGLVLVQGSRVSLTPAGFLLSNAITAKLLFG